MSKKGENIYRRQDNRWEGRYIKGRSPEGKLVYGYCYGRSYRETREKLSEARAAVQRGEPVPQKSRRQTFGQCCSEWLLLSRSRVKESTYVKYESMLERRIRPLLGSHYIEDMSALRIEAFSDRLLAEGLSTKTVRDYLALIRSVLTYAQSQAGGRLPAIAIVYPKESRKEMRVLSHAEQERLTRFLVHNPDRFKFGVLLALLTGLRIGELCALRWRDICFEDETIRVRSTMQRLHCRQSDGPQTQVRIGPPKSEQSRRVIPMTADMVSLCRRWQEPCGDAFVLTGSPSVFAEPRAMQYRFARYARACGLEGVHFHTLRHTFATRCVEAGFDMKSLSEILGHAGPNITMERYVHSSLQFKRDNMNKLNMTEIWQDI